LQAPAKAGRERPRQKLGEYFDSVREVERRIVKSENLQSQCRDTRSADWRAGDFPGVRRAHVDLQALAFQADITRVSAFMMARENVNGHITRLASRRRTTRCRTMEISEKDASLLETEHIPR